MDDVLRRKGHYGLEFRDTDLRRAEEDERKTYDIKALWQRSHEIVNLAARGFKQVEIAEILHITPQTVSNTLNSELGEKKLSEIREGRDEEAKKVTEKIRVLSGRALQTYHEILENENGEASVRDRKDVSDTVLLDLAGMRAPTKHVTAHLTQEEILNFKSRGKLAAKQEGVVIDANTVEEVEDGS